MKKTFLFGMIALLGVSLLFTSCPQEAEEPDTYTVTFEVNDGSTVSPITGLASGDTITAPTAPTKTNYDFGGWYKESALTNEWVFASDTVTANITLYAKWTEGLEDVSYTKTNSTYNPTGVQIASAKKNKVTGVITVTLNGTVASAYTYNTALSSNNDGDNWNDDDWGPWDSTPAAGKYTAVYIDGIFTESITDKVLAIKQTSQALRFYTSGSDISSSVPDKPLAQGSGIIGIPVDPTEQAVKWRLWNTNALADESLSLLLWDEAAPKTVTFEIRSYSAYDNDATATNDVNIKIVIDYSAVTIQ